MYINGLGRTDWPQGVEKNITAQNSFVDNNGFLQILAAQLKYQDPMGGQGSDSGDQIMQMSQFAMIEQLTRMSESIDQLYRLSASGEAINMVGKEVTLKTEDAQVHGVVDKVEITRDGTHYWMNGIKYTHPLILDVGSVKTPTETETETETENEVPSIEAPHHED